jgi:hypothetical protein
MFSWSLFFGVEGGSGFIAERHGESPAAWPYPVWAYGEAATSVTVKVSS